MRGLWNVGAGRARVWVGLLLLRGVLSESLNFRQTQSCELERLGGSGVKHYATAPGSVLDFDTRN